MLKQISKNHIFAKRNSFNIDYSKMKIINVVYEINYNQNHNAKYKNNQSLYVVVTMLGIHIIITDKNSNTSEFYSNY